MIKTLNLNQSCSTADVVAQWCVAEIALAGTINYSNPYQDITVTVSFYGPQGQIITRDAFWCGGNLWKVRFAPTAVGKWAWKTICSDIANQALHQRNGMLECVLYEGALPIYRHGFVRVSDNGRHFTYADGTPFFWLGDTHWQMPDTELVDVCNHPVHHGQTCPSGGQFQHLVADRKSRGFTVYQTYPSTVNPAWWTSPYTSINPERFERVFDVQMDHLAGQGFVIALGFGHFHDSTVIPADDLCRWARYLVARYGAYPVVWITCQEMNAPEENDFNRLDVWQAVAEEIARTDGYGHPHSGHQWVLDVTTRPLGGESWHDWFALQGGHRNSSLTPQARYAGYYAFRPTKPVIETEAMYESVDCGGVADADDARHAAWKAMLCGCAGYTYGAAGVWALKWDGADTRWKEYNHAIEGWFDGMALPGVGQMQVLKDFFLGLPWTNLIPRFNDPAWVVWDDPERRTLLATVGNSLYVAYCHGQTSKGMLKQLTLDCKYTAHWFNPRTGEYDDKPAEIRSITGEWAIPEKPDVQDWVLLVQKNTGPSWPGAMVDVWRGFTRYGFIIEGCRAWVVEPKNPLPGNPWTWCMEFPDAFTGRTGVPQLLANGFFHLHIEVGNTFGCPAALKHLDAFYAAITMRGLARKGTLIGISRGGLYAYNWASQNPDKVVCIYGDAPVCDFKSWPGGKGRSRGSDGDWKALLQYYGFRDEAEALAWPNNPIDSLEPLADAKIPLIHIVGDLDDVVPVAENTAVIEQRYRALNGEITVFHKPTVGHHPHGLDESQELVELIIRYTKRECLVL